MQLRHEPFDDPADLPDLHEWQSGWARETLPFAEVDEILSQFDQRRGAPRGPSTVARWLVAQLGEGLRRWLRRQFLRNGRSVFDVPPFWGKVGSVPFRLVPAWLGPVGADADGEATLATEISQRLPYDVRRGEAILPRFVRVLAGPAAAARIVVLEVTGRGANRTLAALTPDEGLVVGATPLPSDLVQGFTATGTVRGAMRFRMTEAAVLPDSLPPALGAAAASWAAHRTALVALPELCGSPGVVAELRSALGKQTHPALAVAGSWHVEHVERIGGIERPGDAPAEWRNRLEVLGVAHDGRLNVVCSHDKFQLLATEKFEEDCGRGPGPTLLLTAVGIVALGICKDWMHGRGDAGAAAQELLRHAVPVIAVAPALSDSTHDFASVRDELLKELGTVMVFANACGTIRALLRKPRGTACQPGPGEPRDDARSFIAAPQAFWTVEDLNGEQVAHAYGVEVLRQPCAGTGACGRPVLARLRPQAPPGAAP